MLAGNVIVTVYLLLLQVSHDAMCSVSHSWTFTVTVQLSAM